ncbi:MAG TPA: MBL fold metallo-hydrolase [Ilumatobacteraceae bacterium]|jgi:phosphoribosyl 1,2-cyclic phosphodiesterase
MMRVRFHGVRGSTPCQSDDIQRYGGNTSCVSIDAAGQQPLLLDMGTGLRYFGKQCPDAEPFRGHCLLSHLHWDHVQGLPFFTPLLKEGSSLDVYGPAQTDGRSLDEVVSFTIRPPLFPVSVDELPGDVRFHDTADSQFSIGDFSVMSRLIPHLGPTLGFRIEFNGRSVAYLSDHQQPFDGTLSAAAGAMELIDGVDLLIHDSQYTPHEFLAKSTWGHCTIEYAVWLAVQGKVKQLALFHHDPSRRDDDLDVLLECAVALGKSHGLDVIAASEGLTIELA